MTHTVETRAYLGGQGGMPPYGHTFIARKRVTGCYTGHLELYSVYGKKMPKFFCNIFYKTQRILIKVSGINLLQKRVNVFHLT